VLGYTAKFIFSNSWVLSLQLLLKVAEQRIDRENQMLQLVWGYSKLQATRPKERPKRKRVKVTLTLFLTLVYSFTTTTTSNPLEEATWPVLIYYYWSTT
jgi:hypothetical protein